MGVLLAAAGVVAARQAAAPHAAPPFTVISAEGPRALPVTVVGGAVMVSLDDLAAMFQLTVREDTLAGGITVTHKGRTVILTPGQALASAAGRLVSLPAAPVREGRHWLVPVEFVERALGPVYGARLQVRKDSRLVLVGPVRVPRVTVREDPLGPLVRVTLSVSPKAAYTISQEAGRLLVRFDADAIDATVKAVAPQPLLQAIRAPEGGTTVAIQVGPRFGTFRSSVVQQENGEQVMVDLAPSAAEPSAATAAAPQFAAPAATGPLAAIAQGEARSFRTVVIDPGHGGDDPGVKGANGALEKDITLSIARRLASLLESRLGVRALLTRDTDRAVTLDERAAFANNNMADAFVSLHVNASLRMEPSGAQIYYLSPNLWGDDLRQAEATREALPTLGGGTREIEMVPWELAQLPHVAESAALAEAIAGQCLNRVRLGPQPVLQAPLRVLAGANMPAVLVEVGFLTNPDEQRQLVSGAYQNTVAEAIADGLVRFRDGAVAAPPPAPDAPAAPARRQP